MSAPADPPPEPTDLYVLDLTHPWCACPQCGYLMSKTALAAIRLDVGCPDCGVSLAAFRPVARRVRPPEEEEEA